MNDKVVGLRGITPPQPGKIDPDVVKQARWLLDAAEAGQIIGLAAAVNWADDAGGNFIAGRVTYSMIGRLHKLQNSILEILTE